MKGRGEERFTFVSLESLSEDEAPGRGEASGHPGAGLDASVPTFTVWEQNGHRCEDCELRNALDPLGHPRYSKHYGYKLSYACEGCGGTGRAATKMTLAVADALELLTPKQRFVIERRYGFIDGVCYKQAEIASVMGISQQNVAKHEARAKKKILALLGCKDGGVIPM